MLEVIVTGCSQYELMDTVTGVVVAAVNDIDKANELVKRYNACESMDVTTLKRELADAKAQIDELEERLEHYDPDF